MRAFKHIQCTDPLRRALFLLDALEHLHPLDLQFLQRQRVPPQRLEGLPRRLGIAPVEQVARTLRDEEQADGEKRGHDEEGPERDLVGRLREEVLGPVRHGAPDDAPDVHPLGEQGDHDGAEVGRRRLGRVDVGEGHEEAVGQAEDQSADVHGPLARRRDLDDAGDRVQDAGRPERGLSAEVMGEDAGHEGREKSAQREERAYKPLERALSPLLADRQSGIVKRRGEEGFARLSRTHWAGQGQDSRKPSRNRASPEGLQSRPSPAHTAYLLQRQWHISADISYSPRGRSRPAWMRTW